MSNSLVLLLLAFEVLAINELNQEQQCKNLGINNCKRCQDNANTMYGPIQNFCLECIEGTRWELVDGINECVPLPADKFTIKGWGRDCAECGTGNYWNGETCKACRYESSKCGVFSCCNEDIDISCNLNAGFIIIDDKCECRRGYNFKVNGVCHCPDDLTYLQYEPVTNTYSCPACTDKCPIGCANFVCPKGTYLDSGSSDINEQCKCKPVHYSCGVAKDNSEKNCEECNTEKGFTKIQIDSTSDSYCYCDCCKLEERTATGDVTCIKKANPADVYSQCTPPTTCTGNFVWNDLTKKCECSVSKLLIGSECLKLDINNCYTKFSPNSIMVGNGKTYVCQCKSGYVYSSDTKQCTEMLS